MALDHPDRVIKLAVLDAIPTYYIYTHVTIDFVQALHWFNYLRPAPGPENDLKAQYDAQKRATEIQLDTCARRAIPRISTRCARTTARGLIDLKHDGADRQEDRRRCRLWGRPDGTLATCSPSGASADGSRKSYPAGTICRRTYLTGPRRGEAFSKLKRKVKRQGKFEGPCLLPQLQPQICSIYELSPNFSVGISSLSSMAISRFASGVVLGFLRCRPPFSRPDAPPARIIGRSV